jgi:hypothetical protein
LQTAASRSVDDTPAFWAGCRGLIFSSGRAFAKGCLTDGQVWQTQLSALSSYAPIAVWKIDAYAFCPHGVGTNTPECNVPRPGYAQIPNAFTAQNGSVFNLEMCSYQFAVAVESIEYINAENMAVTVLEASFREFDAETGTLIAGAKLATR